MSTRPHAVPPSHSLRRSLTDARAALDALLSDTSLVDRIDAVADLIAERFRTGHKLLACGNGGSACDAMHFVEELTGKFRHDRPPLPAIACSDVGHITCTANDYGFERIFSRWVEALGRESDVLVVLSTSGNSPNILRAIEAAHQRDMTVVAFLGQEGGKALPHLDSSDFSLTVPGETSDRIQELHMLILHTLVEGVERTLFPG